MPLYSSISEMRYLSFLNLNSGLKHMPAPRATGCGSQNCLNYGGVKTIPISTFGTLLIQLCE